MEERQSRGRNFLARKFLGFMSSKRKREEEKKRMDLWKAMRDSSVERLAAVIASARTEFGDQLNDLCSDAEGVLQRLLRESRPGGTKVTLRERLLLADIESSGGQQQQQPPQQEPPREICSAISEIAPADNPPVIQAVLTLMRPPPAPSTPEIPSEGGGGGGGEGGSLAPQTLASDQNAASGRRLLSALLWEERNLDGRDQGVAEGWVAFGVSVEAAPIHFDHSRSQSMAGELNRVGFHHRPSSSLGAPPAEGAINAAATSAAATTVPETPMRVSLMSLLREAEEGGGSGIIFMNRQMIDRTSISLESSPPSSREVAPPGDGIATEQMCCVCMGRPKAAAFIPCGHTFCRRCCRELQQLRGSCPLCNKEIRDVLHLY